MPAVLAIPDIGLVVVGVILLIIGLALYALRDLIVSAFSHLPLVGGVIGRSLGGWLEDAASAVTHASDSAFGGITTTFKAAATWLTRMPNAIIGAISEAVTTIEHIATVQIPRIATLAYHEVVSTELRLQHAIAAAADTAYREVVSTADRLSHDIAAVADTAYHEVVSTADRIEADIAARAAVTEADIAAGVAQAEAYAQAAAAAVAQGIITDLDTWGNQAVGAVWPDAAGDIEALKGVLGDAFPDIQSLLKWLAGAGAAGLLGALIRSLAGTAAITRTMTDCVLPNCDNLSQLGKDLSELGSAAAAAAMLGWLAFIAADPVTAADDTVTVAAPLLDTVFGPLASLLSAGAEHL